jgi:hypothetical protein
MAVPPPEQNDDARDNQQRKEQSPHQITVHPSLLSSALSLIGTVGPVRVAATRRRADHPGRMKRRDMPGTNGCPAAKGPRIPADSYRAAIRDHGVVHGPAGSS